MCVCNFYDDVIHLIPTTTPTTHTTNSPASDWALLQLGAVCGGVESVLVDTCHFKGNFPESVQVDACCAPSTCDSSDVLASAGSGGHGAAGAGGGGGGGSGGGNLTWFPLLPRTRVKADAEHLFLLPNLSSTQAAAATAAAAKPGADGGGPAGSADGGGGPAGTLAASVAGKPVTHVRLTIFPDGGVMRLRVVGKAIAPMGTGSNGPASKL
jgi:allantoicase